MLSLLFPVNAIEKNLTYISKTFQIQASVSKLLVAPSVQFRNAFEIKRNKLLERLPKMRTNLMQQLRPKKIPVFEGGRPGTSMGLQHAG